MAENEVKKEGKILRYLKAILLELGDRRFCVEVIQSEESRGLAKFLTWENSSRVLSFMRPGYPRGRGLVSPQRSVMHSTPRCTKQIYLLDWTFLLCFLCGIKSSIYISSEIYHVSESIAEIFPSHLQCDSCLYHITSRGVHCQNLLTTSSVWLLSLSCHFHWCDIAHSLQHMLIWTTSLWDSSRHNTLIFMFETTQCLAPSNTCI